MRPQLAMMILVVALPAAAQTTRGQAPAAPSAGTQTSARQSAKTAYGYRLTAPDEDDDPTDRRVLRRLNTRLNNRLETGSSGIGSSTPSPNARARRRAIPMRRDPRRLRRTPMRSGANVRPRIAEPG